MEIKGTIIAALPEVSGVSSRSGNPWKKREYVLENTEGNFPRKVAFTCFGENADKIQLQVGQAVTMYFDVERANTTAAGTPTYAAGDATWSSRPLPLPPLPLPASHRQPPAQFPLPRCPTTYPSDFFSR